MNDLGIREGATEQDIARTEHTLQLAQLLTSPSAPRLAHVPDATEESRPEARGGHLEIRALPGRLVLRFPPPVQDLRGIAVPDAWKLRRELGELVAMGAATTKREKIERREILRRSGNTEWQRWRDKNLPTFNRWLGWKRPSCRFLVSMAIGTYYWRKELASYGDEFLFLHDVRTYNIGDLATSIVEVK